MEAEDDIDFANIAEKGVEGLNIEMNRIKHHRLVVVDVDAHNKEEASVAVIDKFSVAPFDECAEIRRTRENRVRNLANYLVLVLLRLRLVPFCQPGLSLAIKDEKKVYHLNKKKI